MGGETIRFGSMKALERVANALTEQNASLKNQIDEIKAASNRELRNDLAGIFGGAFQQTNISKLGELFSNNIAYPITQNYTYLIYSYKTHGLIQTAIDMPVQDALAGGLDFQSKTGDLSEDDIEEQNDFIEENGILQDGVLEGAIWARLFGGGGWVVMTGADPATPMTDKEKFHYFKLYPCARWELGASTKLESEGQVITQQSPFEQSATANQECYQFYGQRVHRSRVITMMGKSAPWMLRWMLQGWGMSEEERMVEDFNAYLRMRNVIYDLMNEAKVDVFKVDGMAALLVTSEGNAQVQQRVNTVQQIKNFNNALLLDKLDEYDQKQITFTGLAEMLVQLRIGLSSCLRIPQTKLFGQSAAGFSSGEDDIENYNAMVEREVRQKLRPAIRRIYNLVHRYLWQDKYKYQFHFKPLRVMSAKDEEEIRDRKFQRVTQMYDRALMNSQEVGEACEKDKLISVDTDAAAGTLDEYPEKPMGAGMGGFGEEGKEGDESGKPTAGAGGKGRRSDTD